MKRRTNILLLLCFLDFFLSNIHVFWEGKYSNNPRYASVSGDLEYWVNYLAQQIRPAILISFIAYLLFYKQTYTKLQIARTFVYGLSIYKDGLDFIIFYNVGTIISDVIVFGTGLIMVEFIFNYFGIIRTFDMITKKTINLWKQIKK